MKDLGTKTLETKRLILRRFKKEDAEEIYNGFINQKDFLYYANKEKRTLQEEKESLERIDEKYNQRHYYNWLITLKDTKQIIGRIFLVVEEFNECVESNYVIDDKFSKNGYMTEALKEVIRFCFEELEVNRFQSCCVIENKASKRVMQKCNMTEEGIIRKYIKLKDGYHDMYMFSIVK